MFKIFTVDDAQVTKCGDVFSVDTQKHFFRVRRTDSGAFVDEAGRWDADGFFEFELSGEIPHTDDELVRVAARAVEVFFDAPRELPLPTRLAALGSGAVGIVVD